ncbi:MAG: ABC-F family ATP-binding cassette domain-containing protein [Anaerolineae bacterium]|nr:ABC-F family ATP-binding cassette domain-containing protein [Anaerolineae bacterium]
MLQVSHISKSYGIQTVLEDVTFVLNKGERLALIGPNGCGKTTLLRIITGLEQADAGTVSLGSDLVIGYLPQGLELSSEQTIDEAMRSGIAGYQPARQDLERLEIAMSDAGSEALPAILSQYDEALERFEALGGYVLEHRCEQTLAHLGLGDLDTGQSVGSLSGGQKTRLGLARLLAAEPDILLLDEPTNHLDIKAIEWLEEFLLSHRGAVLLVSHDRTLLDRCVSGVVAIDEKTHTAAVYSGGYIDYAEARDKALEKQWAQWQDQQEKVHQLEESIRKVSARADRYQNISKDDFQRRKSKMVMQKATAQSARLQRYIESEDRVDKPITGWNIKLDFGHTPRGGQEVIVLCNAGHSYDGCRWLFRGADLMVQHGERIVLVGPNGCGKSTLLKAVVGHIDLAEGEVKIGANIHVGYMPQEQETLDPNLTPLGLVQSVSAINETEARNFLHLFLFAGDEVFTPVGALSYGERSRLLLAKLVLGGSNCLVLDEPLNHLDIMSRERLGEALATFPGTMLITTHDRAFIDRFATGLWTIINGALRQFVDRADMEAHV